MTRRAEVDWAETPYPVTVMGQADTSSRSGSDHPAAVLWVPDPEQRRGWRELYVDKPGAPLRGVGFRKPGER